jgi:hypothetical protein
MGRQTFSDALGRAQSHRGCISFSFAHQSHFGSPRIYYRHFFLISYIYDRSISFPWPAVLTRICLGAHTISMSPPTPPHLRMFPDCCHHPRTNEIESSMRISHLGPSMFDGPFIWNDEWRNQSSRDWHSKLALPAAVKTDPEGVAGRTNLKLSHLRAAKTVCYQPHPTSCLKLRLGAKR